MPQARRCLHFHLEALDKLLLLRKVAVNHFQGNLATHAGIARTVHCRKAAATDLCQQFIFAQQAWFWHRHLRL